MVGHGIGPGSAFSELQVLQATGAQVYLQDWMSLC